MFPRCGCIHTDINKFFLGFFPEVTVDIIASGNRGLETLQSLNDARSLLNSAEFHQDLSRVIHKLQETQKALSLANDFLKANPTLKANCQKAPIDGLQDMGGTFPIRGNTSVGVPELGDAVERSTMKPWASRVFTAGMTSLMHFPLEWHRSVNEFI